MKKESVIVGIFGLSLGLLVAWGIWNFKGSVPQPENLTLSPSPVAQVTSPTPTPPESLLTLDSPQDESLATDSSVLVAGKTKPESTVVISTNLDDYVLTVSQSGNFSQEVNLEEGENILTVTAYGPNQKEEAVEKRVVYTKEI